MSSADEHAEQELSDATRNDVEETSDAEAEIDAAAGDELEEEAEEDDRLPTPSEQALAEVTDSLIEHDADWQPGETLDLGTVGWRPALIRADRTAALHIHQADRLRSHIVTRLEAVYQAGMEVHVAVPLDALYDEELLTRIVGVDPFVHIIDDISAGPERLLACIADRGLQVSPETRSAIGAAGLTLSREAASAHVKGKRFEVLLAFLLSQVADFSVFSRNFLTATEEIDIVIRQRATSGRVWAMLGAPFILVEARNRKEDISQEMFSAFRTKMKTNRGTVRLGLMFAGAGVSSKALLQELRFSTKKRTVVFLDNTELEGWIQSSDGDGHLEDLVSNAMLR